MKEHEQRYVAVAEKYMLNGVNTIILMKHKHRYATLTKNTHMNGRCIGFWWVPSKPIDKMHGEGKASKDQGHGRRKKGKGAFAPLDFGILYFYINFLVEKWFYLRFE